MSRVRTLLIVVVVQVRKRAVVVGRRCAIDWIIIKGVAESRIEQIIGRMIEIAY